MPRRQPPESGDSREQAERLVEALAMTPLRAAVVRYLLTHRDGGSSGEIANVLGVTGPGVLSHLTHLEEVGIVESPSQRLASGRRQRGSVYRINRRGLSRSEENAIRTILGLAESEEPQQTPRLDDFTLKELTGEVHQRVTMQEWSDSAEGRAARRTEHLG